MHTLIIAALGLFFNPATGDTQQAVAQVGSVLECAKVINDGRTPQVLDSGTWYLVDAKCVVVEQ